MLLCSSCEAIDALLHCLHAVYGLGHLFPPPIDLVGRTDDGDQVIAHEFDFSVPDQLIYSRNGVNITSTPVSHYRTDGPVALRLDWNGLSVTYSGESWCDWMYVCSWIE